MTLSRKLVLSSKGRAFLLLSLVVLFLSGTSCLIYEIAWSRLLVQAFGSTLPAICTVLTVFLGGLALGAYISSKQWTEKGNPLAICAVLELLIGAYSFFVPQICRSNEFKALFAQLVISFNATDTNVSHLNISIGYIPQFLTIALVLILPTIFMGSLLPIMCQAYRQSPDETLYRSSLAYSSVTAGAVAGAALAGFVLMPYLGIQNTTLAGALINVEAATLCLILFTTSPFSSNLNTTTSVEAEPDKSFKNFSFLLCTLLAASGILGMVLEIVWTRYFTLILGSTTYAFASVSIAVLLGLAIGALLVSVGLKKLQEPVTTISIALLATAMLAYLGMLSFGSLPIWYSSIVQIMSKGGNISFATLITIQFLTIFLVVLPPTITNGIVFPLCLKALNISFQKTASQVGTLYAVNSLGSIAGAWLSGFILIPLLSHIFTSGIQASLFLVCLTFYALALSTFYFCLTFEELCGYDKKRGPDKRLLGSFVTVILIFVYVRMPDWDSTLLTSGLSINPVANYFAVQAMQKPQALGQNVFYQEGLNSIVSVVQLPQLNLQVLKNNGKSEASLPLDIDREATTSDLSTQTLLGLLPILFHPGKAENVLVIGFGSGATCGSILQSGEVKHLTSVELEPAIIEASKFFQSVTHKPLEDKRLQVATADATNFLSDLKSYDVVVSQPADPWVSGTSDLFTHEFFSRVKDHLADNGLFCQWIQLYDITPEYLGILLNTFQSVFDETYAFHQKDSAEIILIGSKSPYQIDEKLLVKRFNEKSLRKELLRIGIKHPQQIADLLILTPDELRKVTRKMTATSSNRLNTNDNLLTEYQLPQFLAGRQRVCEECLHMLIK